MAEAGASVIQAAATLKDEISPALREIAKELKETATAFNQFNTELLSKFKNVGNSLEENIDKPVKNSTKALEELRDAASAQFNISPIGEIIPQTTIEKTKTDLDEIKEKIGEIKPANIVSVDELDKAKSIKDEMLIVDKQILDNSVELLGIENVIANSLKERFELTKSTQDANSELVASLEKGVPKIEEMLNVEKQKAEQIQKEKDIQEENNAVLYEKLKTQQELLKIERERTALDKGQSAQTAIDYAKQAQGANELATAIKAIGYAQQNVTSGTPEAKQLAAALNDVNKRLMELKTGGIEANKSMSQLERGFQNLTYRVLFYGSLGMLTRFMKGMMDTHSEMEKLRVSFNAFFGDVEKGSMVFERIRDISLVSPHTIQQLGNAVKMLGAYGFELEQAIDLTRRLGDITAITGTNLDKLIPILGYIQDKGFLEKRDLRTLQQAGVNIIPELKKHFSELNGEVVTTNDLLGMMKDKLVKTSDVVAVINKLTDEGGTYWKGQEKIVATFAGQITSLKTSLSLMMDEFGKQQSGVLTTGIGFLRVLVSNYKIVIEVIKSLIVVLGAYKAGQMLAKTATTNTTLSLAGQTNVLKMQAIAWRGVGLAIKSTVKAMVASMAAIAMNPYTWIFAAIAGLAKLAFHLSEVHKQNIALRDSAKEAGEAITKSLGEIKDVKVKFTGLEYDDENLEKFKERISEIFGGDQILINLAFEGTKDIEDFAQILTIVEANVMLMQDAMKNADSQIVKFKESFRWSHLNKNVKETTNSITDLGEKIQGIKTESVRKEFETLYEDLIKLTPASEQYYAALTNFQSVANSLKFYNITNEVEKVKTQVRDLEQGFSSLDKKLREKLPKFNIDFSQADVGMKTLMKNNIDAYLDANKKLTEKQKEFERQFLYKKYYIDVEVNFETKPKQELQAWQKALKDKFKKELNLVVDIQYETGKVELAERLAGEAKKLQEEYQTMLRSSVNYSATELDLAKSKAEKYRKAAIWAGYEFKETQKRGDTEKKLIDSIIKSMDEAQKAYTNFYNLTSDGGKTQEHILRSLGGEWENLGQTLEDLSKVAPSKQAGIDFLENLKKGLKSAEAIKAIEHAIGKLKVEIEIEFEERKIREFKDEMDRIMHGYQVYLEFAKIEDTEMRDFLRNLSKDLGITIGVEFDYDEAISRLQDIIKNAGGAIPTFEQFKAERLEITPEMDISEIEAAWNEFLILSSKSNDQVVANAANAELQILQIRKQKLAEYQKIFEDYVNASRDGNDRIAELVRKNAEDEEKIRLGVNSLGEKLTDEDIANIKRKMALRDVAIAKEQEEIYKTTEAYKKLFTLSIQNKTAKYLKELLDWQRKIIASSKEITSGTKKGRFNVKYLMGLDDMEEVDISLELLQQKFENFNEIFVELGKKNPFIALKIGIEEIQRKDSILTPQQKKELELLTKDIKLDLTTDIVGGIGKLGEAFSGLDSNIGNIVSSFTTVISSIANASKSTASWGDKFNSIITIVVTLGTILYDLIVNFGTKRAMKDVETLNGIIKEVGNTIAANEKALDNFYRRNNIRLEQAKRSGQWNFDKFEEKSGMWDASTQEYENWKRRAYNRKELLDKERAALIEQMRLLKLQQAAYKAAETDKKDYKEEIANNQKQYDELLEKFDYMYADITDKLLGTGLEDAARNFGQIFADSVMEGIDYMDDFRKAFANMIKNLIIESFLLPKMANALSPMFEKIDKLIEEKGDLTEQDVIDIINMGDDILNNMAAYGEALRPLLERLREWTGGLSEFDTLQKGIQGITEQTAGVLESYLNQMRVSVDMLLQNSNFMNVNVVTLVTASSDMLYQMRESVQIQRSIYHLIDSVIAPVNSLPTGMAIKTASIIH